MIDSCLVLVVEDHHDSREMLTEFLQSSGFAVESAADGGEALARIRERRPHVVLMDLSLPGVCDGWEAIRSIKADPLTRDVVVVAVTGWSNSPAHERAIRAGADGVVVKPVNLDELLEHVRSACGPASSESVAT